MGQVPRRSNVLSISNSNPCSVEIDANPGYVTGSFIRLTDLNGAMPNPRGEDPINNGRFRIVLTSDVTFNLHDPITHDPINSSNFPPYVEGGYCNLVDQTFFYHNPDPEE